ncbi:hypothetical protein MN032_11050 [Agromyces atrinae]|uniref:hypothetical protein n=1 Tax=Agromyces atrinae TaxID=592376 RepID=UPI001F57E903|nr:hypothetical protein [Agromyces atrinae]MCI2958235.1 hypothetical protein [Agromyces atrinae]
MWNLDAWKRTGKKWIPAAEDVFSGPWHTVRPYVTTEFREWVDEYYARRLTFTEWQREARAARVAEAARVRDYVDSAEFCTDQLEQWAELNARRDALIVDARERGATFAVLQASTGMSRMALHNVIARAARAAVPDTVPAEWVRLADGSLETAEAF